LDFHPEDVIISLINITVLFFLLRLILWKHVIRFLADRKKRVQSEMDDVEKSRLDVDARIEEYDKKIGELEERGQDLMRESRAKAHEESDRIISETQEKAQEIIAEAKARIEEEKEQALESSREEAAQLATIMAAQILKREVSTSDNDNVVDEFFKDV